MAILDDHINHVVVLMLENRSFDCLFGGLYPKTPDFDGLQGNESNLDRAVVPVPVWNSPGTARPTMKIPDPDPGELWTDMTTQIFGQNPPPAGAEAAMSGFVRNYQDQAAQHPGSIYDPRAVMHHFVPEQLPVLSKLARQFAICDRWHASAPCQTWPNRFFVHAATAGGYENNEPGHVPFAMPTIFTRFDAHQIDNGWKIYFHDVAQAWALSDLWPHKNRFHLYSQFHVDARTGALPAYSFIEPRYFADFTLPNDGHPPHAMTLAEQLVADVYNILRASPLWVQTLLVVTCDEHGGCYDHVPPPGAVPPDDLWQQRGRPFAFDRYGVRVPAVLVSPYIRQGTVLRPPHGSPPFDHTSIISTLRRRFNLGPALTHRDAAAPDLYGVLALMDPANMGPPKLDALPFAPVPQEVSAAQRAQPNGMQQALHLMTYQLPQVRKPVAPAAPALTVTDAVTASRKNLWQFIEAP